MEQRPTRPPKFRFRKEPFEDLLPVIHALTFAVLCVLFIFWRSRSWQQRIGDINVWAACWNLYHLQKPLPALILALGYTVYTCIPGSFAALTLPSHATFMRGLQTAPEGDEDECKICWEDNKQLADLSCGHRFCTGCLDAMGKAYQTACPMCRTPLFSCNDRLIYIFTKGCVTITAVNFVVYLLKGIDEVQRYGWYVGWLALVSACFFGFFIPVYGRFFWEHGDDWWRGSPNSNGMTMRQLMVQCFACASGASSVWMALRC